MRTLAKTERETQINFNEWDQYAIITTCYKPWIEGLKVFPHRRLEPGPYYEFTVPKSRIRMPRPTRAVSPEQAEARKKKGEALAKLNSAVRKASKQLGEKEAQDVG